MLKGKIEYTFTETEDGSMCIDTHTSYESKAGPQEGLFDLTQVTREFLKVMKVETSVQAVMIVEAIRRNDWWGSEKLPYNYPQTYIEEAMTFEMMRMFDDEEMEKLCYAADRGMTYKKEKVDKQ